MAARCWRLGSCDGYIGTATDEIQRTLLQLQPLASALHHPFFLGCHPSFIVALVLRTWVFTLMTMGFLAWTAQVTSGCGVVSGALRPSVQWLSVGFIRGQVTQTVVLPGCVSFEHGYSQVRYDGFWSFWRTGRSKVRHGPVMLRGQCGFSCSFWVLWRAREGVRPVHRRSVSIVEQRFMVFVLAQSGCKGGPMECALFTELY